MVKDGEVVIVDEFTGRLMPGRRWSDGLHQAVEAKEKVKIERENQTLATVTFQNYFRKYKKLSGMTGTADTEAEEFAKIYKLDVVVIPPNRPLRRVENPDLVYRTEAEKWDAIVTEIVDEHAKGRPVLVGTVSIEKSEKLSSMLDRRGLKRGTTTGGGVDKHVVLNAKYHAQEAEFVAQAGRKGAVTIATNMAGRGTDILLGGNPEFMARQQCLAEEIAERLPKGEERFVDDEQFVYFFHLDAFYRVPKARLRADLRALQGADRRRARRGGRRSSGLHIVGTERHEARRIDNQLRGRAGRQGDPGSSRFYLSLEDDLMRIFGSDRISGLMQKLGMEEGVPIEHGMVTRAIERAQKQVEAQNFSVRKHLLEYDDVMNKQRENIYALRRRDPRGQDSARTRTARVVDTREYLMSLAEDILDSLVETYAAARGRLRAVGPRRAEARGRPRVFAIDDGGARFQRSDLGRDPRQALGAGRRVVRREGEAGRPRGAAARRARHHAADRRRAVEGPSLQPRPPEGRHRPARLRPARSARRVQEGELRALPGDEGARGRGDRPLPVVAAAGARPKRRRSPAPAGAARRAPLILSGGGEEPVPAFAGAARRSAAPSAAGAAARQPPRVGGDDAPREDGAARRAEGRPQRSVPVRQRKEIQEMPRRDRCRGQ